MSIWPFGYTDFEGTIVDTDVVGGGKTAFIGGKRQRKIPFSKIRAWIQTALTSLSVAGNITQTSGTTSLKTTTVAGQIATDTNVKVNRDGSDSIGLGGAVQLASIDNTKTFLHQLSADGHADLWLFRSGAGWFRQYRSTNTGRHLFGAGAVDNLTDLIQAYGTCANNTGVWATLSDIRFKENIKDISEPLDKIRLIASKTKHFNFKTGINEGLGKRTGIIIDDELCDNFPGHIKEINPSNEAEGVQLGWEYADEEYTEYKPIMETIKEPMIEDDKIVYVDKQVQKTEIKPVKKLGKDKSGNDIIITAMEPVGLTEPIIKTRRIVTKEGSKARQVENSFYQYLFPALIEQQRQIEEIKKHIGMV